jgi:Cu-Zn family superoxide dismutase
MSSFARATIAAISAVVFAPTAIAAGQTASAQMKNAAGADIGIVTFTEAAAGVLIKFELKGLPPGPHGVHVHDTGSCEGDFTSAGAIFNPLGAQHGFYNDEGPMAGDLPNLFANADGTAVAEVLSPFLALTKDVEDGLFDSNGTALVLFEKADDHLTDPEGDAGTRLACGVITLK